MNRNEDNISNDFVKNVSNMTVNIKDKVNGSLGHDITNTS
jgi:hypothetical protein